MNERERLIIANEWKAARKKDQDMMDMIWLKKVAAVFVAYIYICTGLYHTNPELLQMLFWPFHYGWLAH